MTRNALLSTAALLVVVALSGCGDRGPLAPSDPIVPSYSLYQVPGFVFLPPVGTGSSSDGFLGTLSPTVVVCRWENGACTAGSTVASFSLSGGTDGTALRLADQNVYQVNWNTRNSAVVSGETYQVVVQLGGLPLGVANVAIFANQGQARTASGATVSLVDGQTLPIRFGIRPEAIFALLQVPPGTLAGADFVIQTFTTGGGTQRATVPSGRAAFQVDGTNVQVPGGGTEFTLLIYQKTLSATGECEPSYNGPNTGGCYVFETLPSGVTFYADFPANTDPAGMAGVCPDANATPQFELAKFDDGVTTFPPPAPVSVVDCTSLTLNRLPRPLRMLARLLLPRPLHADDEGETGMVGAFSTIFWAMRTDVAENAAVPLPSGPFAPNEVLPLTFRIASTHVHAGAPSPEPIAGVVVDFTVDAGAGTLSSASAVSDANGYVAVAWTLPSTGGTFSLTATINNAQTPAPSTSFDAEVRAATVILGGLFSAEPDGSAGSPTDAAALTGPVVATYDLTSGLADRLQVWLGTELACETQFTEPVTGPVDCLVTTTEHDEGAPRWLNGTHTLEARLLSGTSVVATTSNIVTLANADVVQVTATAPREALDAAALTWHAGPVSASALPIMYSGSSLAAATFTTSSGAVYTATSAPFTALFNDTGSPAGSSVAGVSSADFTIVVTTIRPTGAPGPSATTDVMRLDNAAPAGGSFALVGQSTAAPLVACCADNWVGGAYVFAAGKAGHADAGVGLAADPVTFHVGAAGLTNGEIAALPAVQSAADLAGTTDNIGSRVVAVVRDRLDNTAVVALGETETNPHGTLGVDHTAPTIAFGATTPADFQVFNAATGSASSLEQEFTTTRQDTPAGFGTNPVLMRLRRFATGVGEAAGCVHGAATQIAACDFTGGGGNAWIPADDGVYRFEAFAVDRAGNVSATIGPRTVISDVTSPTVTAISHSMPLVGGQAATFSTVASDNVHAVGVRRFGLVFGTDNIPFTLAIGTVPDWTTLVPSQSYDAAFAFVASLEGTTSTHAPSNDIIGATAAWANIGDAAGNVATRTDALDYTPATPTPFANRGVQTFQIVSATTVTSGTMVVVRATGPSATFVNPFARVNLYRDVNAPNMVGASVSPTVTDDGQTRTYTWTLTVPGTAPTAPGAFFAIGISGSGEGLRTRGFPQ